jgi:hypothetical protein
MYSKYIKYRLAALIMMLLIGCTEFERKKEVLMFLDQEVNINLDTVEQLNLFILQDQICGACTNSVLNFIYSLDHSSSIIVTSNESHELTKTLKEKLGDSKVFIDKSRLIDKYGLRYANDLVVTIKHGKIDFWSFVKESEFEKISNNIGGARH